MNKNMYNLLVTLCISFLLTINDLLCFGMSKYFYLHKISEYYIILPMFMYSFQVFFFYSGLNFSSMSLLNITWNLVSSILVCLLGIFYFKEKISSIQILAVSIGILSLFLFGLDRFIS